MEFPYGISQQSLISLDCFERIEKVRLARRNPRIGEAALARIVDAELKRIATATEAEEASKRCQLEKLIRADDL